MFVIFLASLTLSCSGRILGGPTCYISGYSFAGNGSNEIKLTFTDNLACVYKLAPGDDRAWIIYIPNAYFADMTPISDNFSDMNIRAVRRTESGVEIYFNSPFEAYSKPHERALSGVEGYKRFVFKKKQVALPDKWGKIIENMFCRANPFLVKIDSDGAVPHSHGVLGSDKRYIDFIGSALVDNFTLSSDCEGIAKVSEVDFPPRVRLVINNTAKDGFGVYGAGKSVYVEEKRGARFNSNYYMLGMNEEFNGNIQILRFYTSGKQPAPTAKVSGDDVVYVNTGAYFRPIPGVSGVKELNGQVFSRAEISKNGDSVVLSGAKKAANAEFYLDKNDNGFTIYLKEHNQTK